MKNKRTITEEITSSNTKTSFVSSLDIKQYREVLRYVTERFGTPYVNKKELKRWIFENEENGTFEIKLNEDRIKVKFKTHCDNVIQEAIEELNVIINRI